MTRSRQIVVQFLGDTKDFDRATNSVEKSTGKLGGRMKKVGLVAGAGLAVGIGIAGKAMYDMGKAAAEDAKSQALLEKALENNAGATREQIKATEDWITAQGEAFGVADDKLRPAMSDLVRATEDVGKAQKLASLAMDVSAGTGKDLGSVAKALAKAQNGQVSGLSRLGIATKDADGKTKDFAQIQDELAKKFGGSAATAADTFEGKMGRLTLMFDEAKEAIGAKLLPVAEDLVDWFVRDGLPAIKKFGDWFEKNLVPPLKEFGEKVLVGARKAFDQFKKALEDARPGLELYGNYIKNVMFPVVKKIAEVALPALGLAFRAIGYAMKVLGEAGTSMWNNVLQPVFKFFAEAVSKVLSGLANMFEALGKVPGMGWAKNVAKDLDNAAAAAQDLADGIKDIPNSKNIKVNLSVTASTTKAILSPLAQAMGTLVPRMATGGVVKAKPGGTLALLAEEGHDEAVVPLSGPHAPRPVAGSGIAGEMTTVNHVVTLKWPDGRTIAKLLLNDKETRGISLGLT